MTDTAKFWPGGIPAYIRCHNEPIKEGLDEEIKGWQLYIDENTVEREPGNEDEDFEVKQRRTLVDQWASFSQAERDEYQNRAPSRGKEDWYPPVLKGNMRRCLKAHGFCNLIVQQPLSPRNRALWAKMRIMMYRLDGEDGTCFGDENKGAGTYVIDPNAAGPSPVKPKDFYSWLWLDPARFDHMAMTSQGTVIFHHWEADMFFADQEALDTGRLLLCHIENNGRVVAEARVCPLFSYHVLCLIEGLGRDLEQIIVNDDAFVLNDAANEVMEMERPILELLEAKRSYIEGDVSVDLWRRDIERYAPGYLDAEARGEGMGLDYDHDNFRTQGELWSMSQE